MTENKAIRLSKLTKEFNVGISTLVDFLKKKGLDIEVDPNAKVPAEYYPFLEKEFSSDMSAKKESEKINLRGLRDIKDTLSAENTPAPTEENDEDADNSILIKDTTAVKTPKVDVFETPNKPKFIDKIDLDALSHRNKPQQPAKAAEEKPVEKPVSAESTQTVENKMIETPSEPVTDTARKEIVTEEVKDSAPVEVPEKTPEASVATETTTPVPAQPVVEKAPEISAPAAKEEKVEKEEIPAPAAATPEVESVAKVSPVEEIPAHAPKPVEATLPQTPVENTVAPETAAAPGKEETFTAPVATEQNAPAAETVLPSDTEEPASHIKVVGFIDLEHPQHKHPAAQKTLAQHEAHSRDNQEHTPAQKVAPAPQKPSATQPEKHPEHVEPVVPEHIPITTATLAGPKIVGNIELPVENSKKSIGGKREKGKRQRIKDKNAGPVKIIDTASPVKYDNKKKDGNNNSNNNNGNASNNANAANKGKKAGNKKRPVLHTEVNDEDVQKQIKETLSRLTSKGTKSKSSKYRRDKREAFNIKQQEQEEIVESERHTLKVTEFVSVNELATLMNVAVTNVISTCMNMGLFVSINQRLDAENMVLVADEFGYKVEFISPELHDSIQHNEDKPEELTPRPPIVTVMGHVDHGKTKLLDYIRNTNVIAGEAGGITQHIGAYAVKLKDGRRITFLDTPGHEAFTAMRARGAKITDVVIIVVAADDGVKQQTIEAINHASAAGVPIVFAINKIDKPGANPDKVKEELSQMNYLVEEWGGKYQSQDISAKTGLNVDLLLEKVLLEAEMLDLKANANKNAVGSVIESSLDKGRGYIATVLVESGTLHTGDIVLAGSFVGNVKAMFNERGNKITEAGPSDPALILGLDGAPQAGDTFNRMDDFKEAREIAVKRSQLQREQGIRTKTHITLEEIGRRIAIGNFQELNIIVKGDVDGSIEALTDSLIKLSTPEIQVNVIHKAVGQISESDILLAVASNAIIVGFQVRPSLNARKLAEKEQIDIRLYSIIYDAIEEIKAAMEGMLSPEIKEEIVATLEIREVFKISKVGTIAGCMVKEGKITRNTKVRLIRDGIVIHTGELGSLKRFKDDVKEVISGYECGLNINNVNDLQVGDTIEGYKETEVKKKL